MLFEDRVFLRPVAKLYVLLKPFLNVIYVKVAALVTKRMQPHLYRVWYVGPSTLVGLFS